MKLSVVIPARNAAGTIGEQLEALAGEVWLHPWEVIVADNGSTDGTPEIVEAFRGRIPGLRVLDASARPGPSFARNTGVAAALADRIAFTDSDDIVAPGWVASMGNALAQFDFVAGRQEFERLNSPSVLKSCGRVQEDGLQVAWYPPFLPHASACNLGTSRRALDAVGGFDESLPCLTDTDLSFRLQAAGFELNFVPDAVVHYRWRGTIKGQYRQAKSWASINTKLYKKYRPPGVTVRGGWWAFAKNGLGLVRRLPKLRSRAHWPVFGRLVGRQLGLLHGALANRVAPLPPAEKSTEQRVPDGARRAVSLPASR